MKLKRIWYRQAWICGAVWIALLVCGALAAKHWSYPAGIGLMALGFAVIICSLVFAFSKLRCPHCGWPVCVGAAGHPNGSFYCPKCGGIIRLV